MPRGPTFGELIRARDTVTAFCEACRHGAPVELQAMADRFGLDAELRPTLIGRLKCQACSSKDVSFSLAPYHKPELSA